MRFLITLLSTILLGAAIIGAAFLHALKSADPYRGFMRNYELKCSRSAHQEPACTFSTFAVETFPIGSDVKDAIALSTAAGFQLIKSGSDSVELLWSRHTGLC